MRNNNYAQYLAVATNALLSAGLMKINLLKNEKL